MAVSNFKHERVKSRKHRKFIASLPCICGKVGRTQSAHVRKNNGGGMGFKPDDSHIIPLCCSDGLWTGCHDREREIGEEAFWERYGGTERATELSKKLFEHTGDRDECLQLIIKFRNDGNGV